jgi:hypothetical protein
MDKVANKICLFVQAKDYLRYQEAEAVAVVDC